MPDAPSERVARRVEAPPAQRFGVEICLECLCRIGRFKPRRWERTPTQMRTNPLDGDSNEGLSFQVVGWPLDQAVQHTERPPEFRIHQYRTIYGRADEVLADQGRLDVDHALPEPGLGVGGTAIVGDERRKNRDCTRCGAPVMATQLIRHPSAIHHQQGPGVVCVHRICMVEKGCMEHFGHTGERSTPRTNVLRGR